MSQKWTLEDIEAYKLPGDPVHTIRQEAEAIEAKDRRVTHPVAAKVLFDHWSKVFYDSRTNETMNVKAAIEQRPGMFALHDQLKQCYSRLLKRTRKDTREQRNSDSKGRKLSELLPRNLSEALNLSNKQNANAELGHLVRLGKVIHYAASDERVDHPRAINDNWPKNVEGSRFWTSELQAEVKRAEAFVRIWRQALGLAGLTLADWVSMRTPFQGDILGGKNELNRAIDPTAFERAHFDRKILLLFGNRIDSFTLETDTDCLDLLRGLIEGTAELRHAVFHFKGRKQLLDELAELPARFSPPVRGTAQRLWHADRTNRTVRLKKALRGAHVEHFLTPDQAAQVLLLLTDDVPADLPLPRFLRILNRSDNAWRNDKTVNLPKPANRRALEVPARLCQYTLLKAIYERPFRSWLKDQSAEVISGWIDRAVARATQAAKAMNAKGDETGRKVIIARAADLPKPSVGGDVTDFFFALSAATASEMRVQHGYESDTEKAREQAEYIDHLLCDVLILSFSQFLSKHNLTWVLDLTPEQVPQEQSTCSLDDLQTPAPILDAKDWQAALYLTLHMLPVESVGRLLHQLFKWEITAGREAELKTVENERLQRLFATLTLYLDMHDAKFEGGNPFAEHKGVQGLFESDKGFSMVFPQDVGPETDRRIPRRGLREIMRFGHMPLTPQSSASWRLSCHRVMLRHKSRYFSKDARIFTPNG